MYLLEDRVKARNAVKRLTELALKAKESSEKGIKLPDVAEAAIVDITNTHERSRQIDILYALGDRIRTEHLAKLLPLAPEEFNAFCEYMSPDEPPDAPWLVWLTQMLEDVEKKDGNDQIVLNVPPGHAKPLHVDTLVLMVDGSHKRLGDITVGDYVVSHTGEPRRVMKVHEQGTLPILKLTTTRGRTILTAPDHSFKMPIRPRGQEIEMFRKAGDLKPNDALTILTRQNDPFNTSGQSIDMFELAALFNACGGETFSSGRSKDLKKYRNVLLWTKCEKEADTFRTCLDALSIPYVQRLNASSGLWITRLETGYGNRLSRLLYTFGGKSKRQVPMFVFRGSDIEIMRYLSTLVNFTAEVPNRFKLPRMHLNLTSEVLVREVQTLLARFNVHATIEPTRTGAHRLILSDRALYYFFKAGLSYEGRFADRLAQRMADFPYTPKLAEHADSVFSIEKAGTGECRCLTVDVDHTFVANDMVVHNSTYASRLFVAWRMGRHPRDKVIGGGHSQRFVENEFSKKIRSMIGTEEYRRVFPKINIDASTRAADQWALTSGGSYVAKGAGQAVHGFRANFACIDDPYAKIADAESPTIRDSIETWFFNDIGSRLLPGAKVFLIMTRFHEDDLTGACMKMNERLPPESRYKIITAPAICYDPENDILNRDLGEVLWKYYSIEFFMKKRIEWSNQRFALTYQQLSSATDPSSIASKFQFYDRLPHETEEALRKAKEAGKIDPGTLRPIVDRRDYFRRVVASVDTASKSTERADYTVIQIWGETGDRKHYLMDQVRGKWEFPEMVEKIESTAAKHGVDAILVEDKGQGTAYIQARGLTDFQRRLAPAPVVSITVNSNQGKEFRFDEITPMIEGGEVFLPERAPWWELFIREVGQFPDSAHDDQVDAMTQYLRWAKSKRTRYGSKKVSSLG